MNVTYEKSLKDQETILQELKALAPSISSAKVTGKVFVIVSDKDLTVDEISAISSYDAWTLKAVS